ncbi:hypothetical protein ACI8AF_13150 [Blastococcus sp. SYSU D00669]
MAQPAPYADVRPAPVLLRVGRGRAARPGLPERRVVRGLGADLFDARLAFAVAGFDADVERFPDPADPDLAAVVTPVPATRPVLAHLATAAADRPVPAGTDEVLTRLAEVAELEDVQLVPVDEGSPRRRLARPAPADGDEMLALVATRADDRAAWLRAGEAEERVLLELVPLGWTGVPLPAATDAPLERTRLRSALVWDAHPQAMLRLEKALPHTA